MLTYLFAALAACTNAASSVLQADSEESSDDNLSLRLIVDLLHKPVWFLGILGVIAGFLLQAAALSNGALAVVEPILIIELPITLLVAGVVFHRRRHAREWTAALAMTIGLAGLLYFLSPSGGPGARLPWYTWTIGIGANLAVIGALVAAALRSASGGRRAALLGVAGGSSFGLTAALMKAMTDALNAGGFVAIFTTWQTYAMVTAGGLAMSLLQSSLNAGPLVAAQPGLTSADPIVSIPWGVLALGNTSAPATPSRRRSWRPPSSAGACSGCPAPRWWSARAATARSRTDRASPAPCSSSSAPARSSAYWPPAGSATG